MFYFLISIFCSADIKFICKLDKYDKSIYRIQFQVKNENVHKEPQLGWTYELISCESKSWILKRNCEFNISHKATNSSNNLTMYTLEYYTVQNHILEKSKIDSENILFLVLYNNSVNSYYYTFIDSSKIKKPGSKYFKMYKMDDLEVNTYKSEGILDYNRCKQDKNFVKSNILFFHFYDNDSYLFGICFIIFIIAAFIGFCVLLNLLGRCLNYYFNCGSEV